jgi:hypothetical protein
MSEDKRPSRRFNPTALTERIVPFVLGILLLALVITLIVILLSVAGLTPGT